MFKGTLVERLKNQAKDPNADQTIKDILHGLLGLNGEVDRLHEENKELRGKITKLEERARLS